MAGFVCVTLVLWFLAALAPAQSPARRPDVVVFLADDWTASDLSAYGNTDIRSPNVAALAKEGLTFGRAYAVSPSCAPSRAALLTGRYGARTGAMFNHQKIRPDVRAWPTYFKALGYETAAIGKVAHYNHVLDYGFDFAADFKYHEDGCVEHAVRWLAERKSDKPLCLFVGTNWPHVPWPGQGVLKPRELTLPPGTADTIETRRARSRYAAAVENADRDLGLVRETVRKHLPAETLFLFSADHGAQWPFGKWTLYENGIRVPLIVAWPGRVPAGKRTDAMVSWVDVLPTLIDAAGGDVNAVAPGLDGRSFLPVLAGRADTHRDRVFATHSGDGKMNFYPTRSARIGSLKYIRNLDPTLTFTTHITNAPADTDYWGSWVSKAETDPATAALIDRYQHRPAEELYDLAADPGETKNLAAEPTRASDLAKLRAALDEWMKANGDEGLATEKAIRPTP